MAAITNYVFMVQCISSLFCSNLIMNSVSCCYEQFQLLELSHFKICIKSC